MEEIRVKTAHQISELLYWVKGQITRCCYIVDGYVADRILGRYEIYSGEERGVKIDPEILRLSRGDLTKKEWKEIEEDL